MEIKLSKTTYDQLHGLMMWVEATPKEIKLSDSVWNSISDTQLAMLSNTNLDADRYIILYAFIKDGQMWAAVQDDETDTEENMLIVTA